MWRQVTVCSCREWRPRRRPRAQAGKRQAVPLELVVVVNRSSARLAVLPRLVRQDRCRTSCRLWRSPGGTNRRQAPSVVAAEVSVVRCRGQLIWAAIVVAGRWSARWLAAAGGIEARRSTPRCSGLVRYRPSGPSPGPGCSGEGFDHVRGGVDGLCCHHQRVWSQVRVLTMFAGWRASARVTASAVRRASQPSGSPTTGV